MSATRSRDRRVPAGEGGGEGSQLAARWRAADSLALSLVVGIAILPRLYRIGYQPIWLDEAVSITSARHGIAEQWNWFAPVDVAHPPLYYSLLHLWMRFGEGEAWLRLLSAVFSTATVAVGYLTARVVSRRWTVATVCGLLLALSPFQVRYAQEVRMYALVGLFAAVVYWATARLIADMEGPRHPQRAWVPAGVYAVAGGLALLTNTSSVFLIAATSALLGWHSLRGRFPASRWLWMHAGTAGVWMVWFPGAVLQALGGKASPWLGPPTPKSAITTLGSTVTHGIRAPWWVLAVAGALIVVTVVLGVRLARPPWRSWALGLWLGPPAVALAVHWWRPVFLDRTLLWTALPFSVLLALVITRIRPRPIGAGLVAVALALSSHGLGVWFWDFSKQAWDEAAAVVAADVRPGDLIVYSGPSMRLPFEYYFAQLVSGDGPDTLGLEPPQPGDEVSIARAVEGYDRVWLIYSHTNSGDPFGIVPDALAQGREPAVDTPIYGVRVFRYDQP